MVVIAPNSSSILARSVPKTDLVLMKAHGKLNYSQNIKIESKSEPFSRPLR